MTHVYKYICRLSGVLGIYKFKCESCDRDFSNCCTQGHGVAAGNVVSIC